MSQALGWFPAVGDRSGVRCDRRRAATLRATRNSERLRMPVTGAGGSGAR